MAKEKKKKNTRRGNGEGSITQRSDGRWQGCLTIGINPDGKPKKAYYYGKSQGEVQDKILEARGKIASGTFADPSKLTLGEWLTTWLNDYMKNNIKPTTWESYETQVTQHIKPAIGTVTVQKLQTRHLQNLYNTKLEGGRADNKKGGLSPRSVRYIHCVLKAALDQAVKEKIITINPADAVKLPKMEQEEVKALDTSEVTTFLHEAKKTKHYAAYYLTLATGVRRGELMALKWSNVDLQEGTISIKENLVRTKKGLIFQEPKTKNSKRTIGIDEDVVKELKSHKAKQAAAILEMGKAYQKNDLVFCHDDGTKFDPRGFSRHFERIIVRLQKGGFTRITFHGLRHTFATLSRQEGTDLRLVSEILGHYDPAFTMKIYQHVTPQMKKEAKSKIGNLLASCAK